MSLRFRTLKLAASLDKGDPLRRKLLAAVKTAGDSDLTNDLNEVSEQENYHGLTWNFYHLSDHQVAVDVDDTHYEGESETFRYFGDTLKDYLGGKDPKYPTLTSYSKVRVTKKGRDTFVYTFSGWNQDINDRLTGVDKVKEAAAVLKTVGRKWESKLTEYAAKFLNDGPFKWDGKVHTGIDSARIHFTVPGSPDKHARISYSTDPDWTDLTVVVGDSRSRSATGEKYFKADLSDLGNPDLYLRDLFKGRWMTTWKALQTRMRNRAR